MLISPKQLQSVDFETNCQPIWSILTQKTCSFKNGKTSAECMHLLSTFLGESQISMKALFTKQGQKLLSYTQKVCALPFEPVLSFFRHYVQVFIIKSE